MLVLRMPWSRCVIMVALISAVVAIIVFYGVTPYNAWREQRSTISEADIQLEDVAYKNQQLQAEIDRLSSYEEIERVARRDHGLVYPGEDPYVVLPPAQPQLEVPRSWPYIVLAGHLAAVAPAASAG